MTSISRPQYRPPPPPPPPPEYKPAQQTQSPAVKETKAADTQQAQTKAANTQQTQPYEHPFDKSSFEASASSGNAGKSGSDLRNVQQTNDVDCGVGALATVGSAAHPEKTDAQLRDQVLTNAQNINDSQAEGLTPVDLGDGTSAQEMSQLAGQQGLETKTFGNFDSGALEKHVTEGNDALMLVDSNALSNARNGTNDKPVGKGGEHWLAVDNVRQAQGKDGQTEPVYTIKDPSTHDTYELTRDQMENVVNAGREGENHTGGGLLVKQAQTGDTNDLSAANANTASVGTTGGDGGTGPGTRNYSDGSN